MANSNEDKCITCKSSLVGMKRYPVHSSRLAVIGYRCEECNEKAKSPSAKKREEEMSILTKEVPKLENANMDIRRALKNT
jgi:hypothetical protein